MPLRHAVIVVVSSRLGPNVLRYFHIQNSNLRPPIKSVLKSKCLQGIVDTIGPTCIDLVRFQGFRMNLVKNTCAICLIVPNHKTSSPPLFHS